MNTTHSRPFGVTLVAILFLAASVLSLFIAARYVLNPAGNEEMILLFTRLKIPVTFLNLLAVPPLVSAGLGTLLYRGLWEGKAWSRVTVVMFSFIVMLTALMAIAFLQVFRVGGPQAIWLAAGGFVLSAVAFVYFLKIPWPETTPHPAVAPLDEGKARIVQPSSSPPRSPEPAPIQSLSPQLYDSMHSAPTVIAGVAITPKDETVRLEPAQPSRSQPIACLTAISGQDAGKRFDIFSYDVLVGRHPTLADILLTDPTVSSRHARMLYQEDSFTLHDLDSTNGSFVNGQRVQTKQLQDQDHIKLGAVELLFSIPCQQ